MSELIKTPIDAYLEAYGEQNNEELRQHLTQYTWHVMLLSTLDKLWLVHDLPDRSSLINPNPNPLLGGIA